MTYDAFGLLFEAMSGAGRAEPAAIRDALAKIVEYPGVTGPITYRGTDGDPHRKATIVQIHEGKTRLVKLVDVEPRL